MANSLCSTLEDIASRRHLYRQRPVQTNHLRTGAALMMNVEHLAVTFPSHLGFLTLTFSDYPDPYTAVARLKKLLRKFKKLFKAWIWVIEFQAECKLHFHLAVLCHQDIRTGFDIGAYDALKALSSECRAGDRAMTPHETILANALKRSLKANPALKSIQKTLRKILSSTKECRFGYHFELTGVRKTPADLGGYFRKNYTAAVHARHRRYPGVHLTGSSRSCPRIYNSTFAQVNSQARFNYKAIAEAMDIPDMAGMTLKFGARWAMALEPVIDELRLWISPDPAQWPRRAIQEAVEAHLGTD